MRLIGAQVGLVTRGVKFCKMGPFTGDLGPNEIKWGPISLDKGLKVVKKAPIPLYLRPWCSKKKGPL